MRKIFVEEFIEELKNWIKGFFPKAEFYAYTDNPTNDEVLRVWWKLNNDPKRPSKPSRTILILFPQALLDDYEDSSSLVQRDYKIRLKEYIKRNCAQFEPDYTDEETPQEKWEVPKF